MGLRVCRRRCRFSSRGSHVVRVPLPCPRSLFRVLLCKGAVGRLLPYLPRQWILTGGERKSEVRRVWMCLALSSVSYVKG